MGVKVTVIDKDLGYKAFRAAMLQMEDDPGVYVGVRQEDGQKQHDENDDATIAEIAAYNEFGGDPGPPERSFLRSTVDENRSEYEAGLAKVADDAIVVGKTTRVTPTLKKGFDKVGAKAARDVRKKIRDLRTPPNARSTIRAKTKGGRTKDNPLIDTGTLRRSIDHETRLKT